LVSRETALKIAQTQYDREVKLKRRDATSDESLENANNTLAQAQAAVEETKSLITQARISVSNAETNLGYTKISAPLNGTVVSIPVEEGQTVNANQSTPTIVQVADLSQMEIKMQISEGDVTKVKPGMAVTYTILSEPDRVFEGTLKSVDPGLTTLTDDTYIGSTDDGTAVYYYGKLVVPNEDGILRIGMTTQNVINVASATDVLTVPSIAITNIEGRAFVQVMEGEGSARKPAEREIQVGVSDNMNTEVLEGLAEGDEVVAAQMTAEELAAGAQVRMRGGMRL
jgi:macrolide-specific efflux system membrane fusion protein